MAFFYMQMGRVNQYRPGESCADWAVSRTICARQNDRPKYSSAEVSRIVVLEFLETFLRDIGAIPSRE